MSNYKLVLVGGIVYRMAGVMYKLTATIQEAADIKDPVLTEKLKAFEDKGKDVLVYITSKMENKPIG